MLARTESERAFQSEIDAVDDRLTAHVNYTSNTVAELLARIKIMEMHSKGMTVLVVVMFWVTAYLVFQNFGWHPISWAVGLLSTLM